MRAGTILGSCAVALVLVQPLFAQDQPSPSAPEPSEAAPEEGEELKPAEIASMLRVGSIEDLRLINSDKLTELFHDVSENRGLLTFLKDVNFRIKIFDEQDTGHPAALGLQYDFQKALVTSPGGDPEHPLSLSFNFYGRGNVAFEADVNPEDFLDTGFQLHVFSTRHWNYSEESVTAELNELDVPLQEAYAKWAKEDLEAEEIYRTKEWQHITRAVQHLFGTELMWDVSGHASLESNQDFSSKQYAYGVLVGFVLREWNPGAPLANFNLFDYPAAFLRVMTGSDSQFRPSGRAWPSLSVGLDLVDPSQDEARRAIGETGKYARWRGELAMRTEVAQIEQRSLWLSLDWRYYHDLDAPDPVDQADLEMQSFFAASLDFPQGWFLRYATGKLPVDQTDTDVFELGFKYSF
jgi:hypothetical protein